MKKIFALMIAASFGFGSIGCEDKKTPSTPAKTGTTKTETTMKEKGDGKMTEEKKTTTEEKKEEKK